MPWSTPGAWTITTVDGSVTTGYLPAWAEDDPSEVGVLPAMLPVCLAGIGHRTFFDGQMMNIVARDSMGGEAEEEAVFAGSIDCVPYAVDTEARLPVVNIEICPGYWILGLDPAAVARIAAQLRAQADLLTGQVRPALTAARDDWSLHHPS